MLWRNQIASLTLSCGWQAEDVFCTHGFCCAGTGRTFQAKLPYWFDSLDGFPASEESFRVRSAQGPVQKKDATNLNNSNARKAIQAALVIKPTGMVAMTTILRIGRSSYPTRRSRTVPGPVAVGELPVPHRSDHQVKCQLLAAI